MKSLFLSVAVAVGVCLTSCKSYGQQPFIPQQPQPQIVVIQHPYYIPGRVVYVPQKYQVQHQVVFQQGLIFKRLWWQRNRIIYTPIQ